MISVVIPLYNRADLVLQTLESVESQDLKPGEVIIVDDHSTDGSLDVVRRYAARSPLSIQVLSNDRRKGVSGATNAGVARARGSLVALLDSDDLWMPGHLRQVTEALQAHPEVEIGFSAFDFFGTANDLKPYQAAFKRSVEMCLREAFEQDASDLWLSGPSLLEFLLARGFAFRLQASVVRKTVFDQRRLSFNEDIEYTQDAHFATLAAHHAKFLYVNRLGVRIRRHEGNDGDHAYGSKIAESYRVRAQVLKTHFSTAQLTSGESRALRMKRQELLTHVMRARSSQAAFPVRARESLQVLCEFPSMGAMKSGLKNLLDR